MSAPAEATRRRGWIWPVAIFALLALHAGIYLTVVSIATRDPHFSVEPDYYEKSMRWDETAAQLQANQILGWSVEIESDAQAGADGNRRLVYRIRDRARTPIENAQVDLVVFHHAHAAERPEVALFEESPGVYVGHPGMGRPGTWECRLTAHRGNDTFTHVDILQIGGVAWQR